MHAFMAAALATGAVVAGGIPVTGVGEAGWQKYGEKGAFSVEFDGDYAVFTDDVADAGVDMQLRRFTLSSLNKYMDAKITGDNAHLALEAMVKVGDADSRYTSIVFTTDNTDQVQLTWGGDADTFMSTTDFFAGVESGHITGMVGIERVGHTNTADTNGETAKVDEVTLKGETFDFGAAVVPNTIVEVGAVGDKGWNLGGNGDFDLKWTPEGVEFSSDSGPVDMRLTRVAVASVEAYRDVVVDGTNAFFTVEGLFTKPGTQLPTYTSIVFSSEPGAKVQLTWGPSVADEYLTMDEFQQRIDDGTMKGLSYAEHVGHTNTADIDGETAFVDAVSFGGTTYDFGGTEEETKPEKPNKPGKPENPGNPDKPNKPGKPEKA